VLDAYAGYMAGFDEIATLQVCGSYREGRDSAGDVLHLFAATAADPPIYYYRTIEGLDDPTLKEPSVRRYTPWQKLDLQIPVRRVSPIVYQGRLFVFWIEILTKPVNTVLDGTSKFTGYTHTIQLKYSYLRLDGRWTPSQRLGYIPVPTGATVISPGLTTDIRPGLLVADPLVVDATEFEIENAWPGVKAMSGDEKTTALAQIAHDIQAVADGQDDFVITYDPQTLADIQDDGLNPYGFTEHMDQYRSMVKDYFVRMRYPQLGGSLGAGLHKDPLEGYTLHGPQWDTPYPFTRSGDNALYLAFGDFRTLARVDFLMNAAVQSLLDATTLPAYGDNLLKGKLYYGISRLSLAERFSAPISVPEFAFATIVARDVDPFPPGASNVDALDREVLEAEVGGTPSWTELLTAPTIDAMPIDGSVRDATVLVASDELLVDWWPRGQGQYVVRRLGTTRGPAFSQRLFEQGFGGLLDKTYQMGSDFNETAIPASLVTPALIQFANPNASNAYLIDFAGPMGVYFREIFFHIPFLLANYANSQQEFSLSQTLYHHIFNPTAPVNPNDHTAGAERDRPWQYREFVGLKAETLRDILNDQNVLNAYARDPFNPHAIARLHLSIYQKSIVMKYVDNLLDWGDSLFTQFTMESINEALMLYVMAADILGPKPLELPSCGEADTPMTYAKIRPQLDASGEFLIELENVQAGLGASLWIDEGLTYVGVAPGISTASMVARSLTFSGDGGAGVGAPTDDGSPGFAPGGMGWNDGGLGLVWNDPTGTSLTQLSLGDATLNGAPPIVGTVNNTPRTSGNIDFVQGFGSDPGQYSGAIPFPEDDGTNVVGGQQFETVPSLRDGQFGVNLQLNSKVPPKQTGGRVPNDPANLLPTRAVFCVPVNEDLLGYWDRAADRLFKIRHCMDISGAARQPDLFAPEIDPRLLVRMAAAGLTLADVLESTRGDLPPYRFQYLVEKAKQFAQTLQNLTSQGQSALEKKDAAELAQLRAVHEQNLLKIRRQAMQLEIDAAKDTADSLRLQKTAIENRRDYYINLADTGLQPWEITQQVSRHVASGIYTVEATLGFLAGALHLVPDLGSPFAITYGGKETGDSVSAFAHAMAATAKIAEAVSSSAGLEATFQRRNEEWQHQINLAIDELKHHEKAIAAADIRVEIATQALAAQDKAIEQAEDVFNLYRDQFTGLGLFTFLSTELYRLRRLAFNSAFGVAKMVEQAYRFERPDDSGPALLETSYWDSEHAGLLAGERLLLDLQQLERRFIETNYRTLEITQSFSLLQFAPDQLVKLRETGVCTFTVPEVFFDLHYPGHYNRIIKAVRLTIPSVVGPYTNVAATLRLNAGKIRTQPKPTSTPVPVPLRHTISVSASSAQNDAGVFEFGFRDERYMPFEGGGAIDSQWEIRLPDAYRAFDYRTISDVILHISYTASEDAAYRAQVDSSNGQLAAALRSLPTERLFNLRSEFPSAWAKFKDQQPTATKLAQFTTKLDARYYPFWTQSALSSVVSARLYAKTSANTVVVNTSDGTGTPDPLATKLGSLFYGDLTNNKPASPVDTVTLNLNDNSMDDLWLLIAWN
jgi:Tc toxin complex TcA C-terminal TcB-binding domain/Neuraminidase-like domain